MSRSLIAKVGSGRADVCVAPRRVLACATQARLSHAARRDTQTSCIHAHVCRVSLRVHLLISITVRGELRKQKNIVLATAD